MGRGAPNRAQRPIPLLRGITELGVGRRCKIAERAVRPDLVVVVPPGSQSCASVAERREQRLVQQIVAQTTIETLDKGILRRLAGRDVVPFN